MTIGNLVDYLWSEKPIPFHPNMYQTWWGLFTHLDNDLTLIGRSFVLKTKNEHGEVEYHRLDPMSVAIIENKETKEIEYRIDTKHGIVTCKDVIPINPFIKENDCVQ